MRKFEYILFGSLIALGVLLRMIDVTVPDIATDEAQYALGVSAAHPPLGLMLLAWSQALFGMTPFGVRFPSIIAGILIIPALYLLAQTQLSKKGALLTAVIAALFPAGILFSRLAYLDTLQILVWILLTWSILRIKHKPGAKDIALVFFTCVIATFIKAQGVAIPGLFFLGRIIAKREKIFTDPIAGALFIGMIPFGFYALTQPGIAATLFLYGGNMYGVSGFLSRLHDLITVWLEVLPVYSVAIALSVPFFLRRSWEVQVLILFAILQGFLLGPSHAYYTAHLIPVSILLAALLLRTVPILQWTLLGIFTLTSVSMFAPQSWSFPWTYALFTEESYWNANAQALNEILKDTSVLTTLGNTGHHVRWYLRPRILVGKDMDPDSISGTMLILPSAIDQSKQEMLLYEDNYLRIEEW